MKTGSLCGQPLRKSKEIGEIFGKSDVCAYLCNGFGLKAAPLHEMASSLSLQQAHERLSEFLTLNEMRQTPERFAILESVWKMKRQFAASDLMRRLEEEGFHVSRSTVYQALELLCRCGLLSLLPLEPSETRYAVARPGFLHLVCTSCGKIREEKDPTVTAHFKGRKFEAFTPAYFSTAVYGVCSVCARRARRKSKAAGKKN